MRRPFFLMVVGAFMLAAIPSWAGIPHLIHYQGMLTDDVGQPLSGTYKLQFFIYTGPTGGTPLWSEFHLGIPLEDGLFTVLLGEFKPIPDSVFDEPERYLGIKVGTHPELSPRVRLTSVAYAYRSQIADTAFHAMEAVSAESDSDWTISGIDMYSAVSGDVGIGTSTPSAKLDVAGNIHSSNTVLADRLQLGTTSEDGELKLYGDASTSAYMQAREASNGGVELTLFDDSGWMTHFLNASENGGGNLLMTRNGSGAPGFRVVGNYLDTEEPYVSVEGSSRDVIFDMRNSGDESVQLPYSSISSMEMKNEAGIGNSRRTTGSVSLDGSVQTILSRWMSFPTAGYALVIATALVHVSHTVDAGQNVFLGVSQTAGEFPADQDNLYEHISSLFPTGNYANAVTVHSYFPVTQGFNWFYFLAKLSSGTGYIGDANMTIIFFPTDYSVILGGSPGKTAVDEIAQPEQAQMEAMIAEWVKAETRALRAEFEAKLAAVREEMAQLKK